MLDDESLPAQLQVYVESPVYNVRGHIKSVSFIPYTPERKGLGVDRPMALSLVQHIQHGHVGYQLRGPKTGTILRTVVGHWTKLLRKQNSGG